MNAGSLMKNTKKRILFPMLFLVILLYPVSGLVTDRFITLNGVTQETVLNKASLQGLMNGEWQSELNQYLENHFWGRKLLIKLRSQGIYSGFNMSPNSAVVVGKDKYLYEPEYINRELNIYPVSDEDFFNNLIDELVRLDRLCAQNGKELYVFITPNKASFCKEQIPKQYMLLSQPGENNYERFVRHLADTDLKYFDSHAYIADHLAEVEEPAFYPTGIHWSRPWGGRCTIAFAEYVSENSKWQLGRFEQTVAKKRGPSWPDNDLYQSLNLILPPSGIQYYKSRISTTEEGDHPSVFLRGGSFLGQSLNALGMSGAVDVCAHFENNYCFLDNYERSVTFTSFDSYDEFTEMGDYLSKADILILEVNEAAVPVMSWGFIEYLLENPQLMQSDQR